MILSYRPARFTALVVALTVAVGGDLRAQGAPVPGDLELTLERMVELGLRDSYQVRQLQLNVERTRSLLEAERARLKSRVQLEVAAPEFQAITQTRWNSDLQRNELVAENSRRWQMDLSVRQPVILFGYPTNGFLSLNNRVYRYNQIDDDGSDIRYYNRYFVGYQQPLFQPNRMKNDLEQAQLNLEDSEFDYQDDVVGMIDDLAGEYYNLVRDAHRRELATTLVDNLQAAVEAARAVAETDPTRAIEVDQVRVELANAMEDRNQAASNLRLQLEGVRQRLRIPASQDVSVSPDLVFRPVQVDATEAIERARTMAPRLHQLEISRRQNEIRLDEVRGNNSFRMNLNFTYGREVQDPRFGNLWTQPRNSYTFDVTATVPIWDWGERQHRVQAQQYALDRSNLSIEDAETQIETNVRSQVLSLQEYQQRLINMQQNLELAAQLTASTLERYRAGDLQLVDLLQTINRQDDTADNFLAAFMGYQQTLRRLQETTFYDFENDMPLVERFGIRPGRSLAGDD